jgi:hypothetical protein
LTQPGQHSSVIIQTLSPSVTINIGNHWTLQYEVSLPSYSSGSGLSDTVGQSVSLSGSTTYAGWNLGLSQGYSFSDTPLIQTGAQTAEESYVTSLSVAHSLAGNFSFAAGVNQSLTYANQYENDSHWSGDASLNYAFMPRLSAGLSFGGGYDGVSESSDITSESYQGFLMFSPGTKTSLSLGGGIQVDQFGVGGAPSLVSPVFSASLGYHLFKNTSISVSAGRSISPSFFSNLISTATSVSAGLQQHLSQKLSLSATGGYSSAVYESIVPGPQRFPLLPINQPPVTTVSALEVARKDSFYSVGIGVQYAFRQHLSGSLSYTYATDASSVAAFGFATSQIGISLSLQY